MHYPVCPDLHDNRLEHRDKDHPDDHLEHHDALEHPDHGHPITVAVHFFCKRSGGREAAARCKNHFSRSTKEDGNEHHRHRHQNQNQNQNHHHNHNHR